MNNQKAHSWTTTVIVSKTLRTILKHPLLLLITIASLLTIMALVVVALLLLYVWKNIHIFDPKAVTYVEKLAFAELSFVIIVLVFPLLSLITLINTLFNSAAVSVYIHECNQQPYTITQAIQNVWRHMSDLLHFSIMGSFLTMREEGLLQYFSNEYLTYIYGIMPSHKFTDEWMIRLMLVQPIILIEHAPLRQAISLSEQRMIAFFGPTPRYNFSFKSWDITFILAILIAILAERIVYYLHHYVASLAVFFMVFLLIITMVWLIKSLLRASLYQYMNNQPTGILDTELVRQLIVSEEKTSRG